MTGINPDPMSAYGRVLRAKIALFGLTLVLAAVNRYWLTPRLAQRGRSLGVLVCSIVEQALAAAVLLAVNLFRLMSPSM